MTAYAAGPAHFRSAIAGRHLDEQSEQSSNRSNKKPRLNNSHGGAANRTEGCQVCLGNTTATHSPSLQISREPTVSATAVPPRHTEAAGVPSFLASIMDTTYSYNSSLNDVPSTWGPYSRSSHTSPPAMSPATSGSLSRRGSGNSVDSPAVPSPAPSSGSTSRDGGNTSSHRASDQSQSPPSYTFVALQSPNRTLGGGPPNNIGTSTFSHAALLPASNAISAPLMRSPVVYTQPPTYYVTTADSQAQPAPPPFSSGGGSYYNMGMNQAPLYTVTARPDPAPFAAPFRSGRQELEYPGFVQAQVQEHEARFVEEGEWTSLLAAAEEGTFTESLPSRAVVHTSPAALHNIINPADDEAPICAGMHQHIQSHGHDASVSNDAAAEQSLQLVQTDIVQTDKGGRRPRSTFSFEKRQETSQTRTIGACLRCKSQRIRVGCRAGHQRNKQPCGRLTVIHHLVHPIA